MITKTNERKMFNASSEAEYGVITAVINSDMNDELLSINNGNIVIDNVPICDFSLSESNHLMISCYDSTNLQNVSTQIELFITELKTTQQ